MALTQTDNSVSICSVALQALGSRPINSFDENTEGARICASLYLEARNDVLRQHDWNCIRKRIVLSPLADKPAFGWQNAFQLPGDYVGVVTVGAPGYPDTFTLPYTIEGTTLLCNADTVWLQYSFRNGVESTWSRDLVAVMVARMKMELAYPITKDRGVASDQRQNYEIALARAKLRDGQETPPQEFVGNPLLGARGGW